MIKIVCTVQRIYYPAIIRLVYLLSGFFRQDGMTGKFIFYYTDDLVFRSNISLCNQVIRTSLTDGIYVFRIITQNYFPVSLAAFMAALFIVKFEDLNH